MWKLKIAQGNDEPFLYSTNNFVGRQIWEYDPNAGTTQERDEVEKAREHFTNNRRRGLKFPSGDLLMRMQLIKESGMDLMSIPVVRIGEEEEVKYEAATTTVKKAVRLSRAIQAKDGHWPAENSGSMYFTPLSIYKAVETVVKLKKLGSEVQHQFWDPPQDHRK